MSVISLTERRLKQQPLKGPRNGLEDSRRSELFDVPKPPEGITSIGIDLGTTNTVVSIFGAGTRAPQTLEFAHSKMIPSVVYWNGSENLVGHSALEAAVEEPHEIIRSSKRKMGKSEKSSKTELHEVDAEGQSENPRYSDRSLFVSRSKEFSAEDVAAAVLASIANHPALIAEKENFGGIWVVITVPAHFDDAARRATLEAASRAGFYVLRIINEPTAAALAYSFLQDHQTLKAEREDLVVFDLGGGTFDVSVVHRDGMIFKVLASEGDVELGGDDLDELLADYFLQFLQPEFLARRASKGSEIYKALLCLAAKTKHELGEIGEVALNEKIVGGDLQTTISREKFEELALVFLEKTLHLTEQAIHMARLRAHDVSRILLVGGSTRLPLVRKLLESYFPKCEVDGRLEPDLAVSWGAALQAAIILGTAPETVLVDVCNHTLGIGVVDDSEAISEHYKQVQKKFGITGQLSDQELKKKLGKRLTAFNFELQKLLRVAPIIRRNSALPAKKSEFFSTLYDNQPAVHVIVAQGEGETVGANRFIGSFLFELTQPCPKGSKCEIQLTYDVNGMVQVFAHQLGTENESMAQFDSRTGAFAGWTQTQAEPASTDSHEALEETVSENMPLVLNALLARAKRVLKTALLAEEDQAEIQHLMQRYNTLLHRALTGHSVEGELSDVEELLFKALSSVEN